MRKCTTPETDRFNDRPLYVQSTDINQIGCSEMGYVSCFRTTFPCKSAISPFNLGVWASLSLTSQTCLEYQSLVSNVVLYVAQDCTVYKEDIVSMCTGMYVHIIKTYST